MVEELVKRGLEDGFGGHESTTSMMHDISTCRRSWPGLIGETRSLAELKTGNLLLGTFFGCKFVLGQPECKVKTSRTSAVSLS